ncbi:ATP-binding protein [Streptomyces sp. NPDC020965]|uniref:ATP-binding protein n=1 Tax=Streptomyces sp. NPDC020965 TaxID=3365105 RepID=UPI0037901DD6
MDKDTFGAGAAQPRPPRDPGTPDFTPATPAPARIVRIVAGDLLLTINPVDGSEIELRPPGGSGNDEPPTAPAARTTADRAELARAGRPPVPPGPAAPRHPLLERDEQRELITRLLGLGRTLRVTGPRGSGRTTLLDTVAEECADLAPDGTVRLNGHHRTPTDLLYDLFAAVHRAPSHRPDRSELLTHIGEFGAIVVIDDLEFGGAALGELLAAAPECAFLLSATPDVPEPAADSRVEEVTLPGLGRTAALELLRRTVDRPLTEDEENWAGDLWFESEGLPLRFVQAGALLHQCDEVRAELRDDPGAFEAFAPYEIVDGDEVPLPTLAQGAAPAALLAARLGESARRTLRLAVALGGEVPHQAHLPALIGDTHADAAVGELMGCGLLSPVGGRYRLAAGVLAQLTEKGYADDAVGHAHTAAQHYTWWSGHPSVTSERAVAEADAVIAALTALVSSKEPGHPSAAVLLARGAAPVFAAGLHWGAWERVLRIGSEAARRSGEVAEEAYFHHELGVLALCAGGLDRARAELEASIALRGALADKSGTLVGRRALALVTDRENGLRPGGRTLAVRDEEPSGPGMLVPVPSTGTVVRPTPATPMALPARSGAPAALTPTVPRPALPRPYAVGFGGGKGRRGRSLLLGTRRNLTAAGAGALLLAVLGTMVTLGATSDRQDPPGGTIRGDQSATEDGSRGTGTDAPSDGPGGDASVPGTAPNHPEVAAPDSTRSVSESYVPSRAPSSSVPSDDPPPSTGPTPSESTGPTPSESTPTDSPPPSGSEPPPSSEPPASSEPPGPSDSTTPDNAEKTENTEKTETAKAAETSESARASESALSDTAGSAASALSAVDAPASGVFAAPSAG